MQAQLATMPDQTSPAAVALAANVKAANTRVDTLFKGETLRGLLLTSYGFSIFGTRAHQAALVCFAVAIVLLLASIAGFIHAATKSADQQILTAHEPVEQSA